MEEDKYVLNGKFKEKSPLPRPMRSWDKTKCMFKNYKGRVWTGFIWLKINTSGGLLLTR
jgi:hypothetical protein